MNEKLQFFFERENPEIVTLFKFRFANHTIDSTKFDILK